MKYRYVTVQFFGCIEHWEYEYCVCEDEFITVDDAYKAGIKEVGHDDFIVAEMKRGKCVAVHILGVGRFEKDNYDYGEYVTGINKELGVYQPYSKEDTNQ